MLIFGEFADKYHQSGYPVIPLNGKIPLIKNWQDFSYKLPPDHLMDEWIDRFANSNIGIVLGSASGLVAFDMDCEDKNILDKIYKLVPLSPLEKKGKKGFTRFYRYDGEASQSINHEGIRIADFLSEGRQSVLPPSVHPETKKPYVWKTRGTILDIDLENLPKFPSSLFDEIYSMLGAHGALEDKSRESKGRNDNLKTLVCAYITRLLSINDIASRIYLDDLGMYGQEALFSDFGEYPKSHKYPYFNALTFVMNIFRSINNKRIRRGEAPEINQSASPSQTQSMLNTFEFYVKIDKKKIPQYIPFSDHIKAKYHLKADDSYLYTWNGKYYDYCIKLILMVKHIFEKQ